MNARRHRREENEKRARAKEDELLKGDDEDDDEEDDVVGLARSTTVISRSRRRLVFSDSDEDIEAFERETARMEKRVPKRKARESSSLIEIETPLKAREPSKRLEESSRSRQKIKRKMNKKFLKLKSKQFESDSSDIEMCDDLSDDDESDDDEEESDDDDKVEVDTRKVLVDDIAEFKTGFAPEFDTIDDRRGKSKTKRRLIQRLIRIVASSKVDLPEIFQFLLNVYCANGYILCDQVIADALRSAFKRGNANVIQGIKQFVGEDRWCPEKRNEPWPRDSKNRTFLHIAVLNENNSLRVVLLALEASIDEIRGRDEHGETALMKACKRNKGALKIVKEIVQVGKYTAFDLFRDEKDNDGANVFHHAAATGHVDVLKHLLSCISPLTFESALLSIDKEGKTPAHYAGEMNQKEVLEYLYDDKDNSRVKLSTVQDSFGYVPAVAEDHCPVCFRDVEKIGMGDNSERVYFECGHGFCVMCLLNASFFQGGEKCLICRKMLTKEESSALQTLRENGGLNSPQKRINERELSLIREAVTIVQSRNIVPKSKLTSAIKGSKNTYATRTGGFRGTDY